MDHFPCVCTGDVVLADRCTGRIDYKFIEVKKMKEISNNYVLVKKLEEEKKEGFQAVEVQDNFVYKAVIVQLPKSQPMYLGDQQLAVGDVVMFAKYSPDTHEIELEGVKHKFINVRDLLAVI